MNNINVGLADQVKKYCSDIGCDKLLVQGAGGNVSWKENDILWIKASGTWLSESLVKDIFVPVDLLHLQSEIKNNNFEVKPVVKGSSSLRPSIETLLHALMPYEVVVHIHAIDILAYLVCNGCETEFHKLLGDSVSWIIVDYFKPGADLALSVHAALQSKPHANVVFMKNHGVVIGAKSIDSISAILNKLTFVLARPLLLDRPLLNVTNDVPNEFLNIYFPVEDLYVNNLAINLTLYGLLKSYWALYPDHVVFLGEKAHIFDSWSDFKSLVQADYNLPELVFIKQKGVYALSSFNKSKLEQLRCYYEVLIRQTDEASLHVLSSDDIGALLNWDAERYRMANSK